MDNSQPVTIKCEEIEIEEWSFLTETLKGEFSNALLVALSIYKEHNLLSEKPPKKISSLSRAMGEKISKVTIDVLHEFLATTDEELILHNESDNEETHKEVIASDSQIDNQVFTSDSKTDNQVITSGSKIGNQVIANGSEIDSDFSPDELHFQVPKDHIPLDYKEKVVALAEAHPTWSLTTLQRRGAHRLKRKDQLQRWKEDILKGGTRIDKFQKINAEILSRFKEARKNNEKVTTKILQQWAMTAANPFLSDNFHFTASEAWLTRFKRVHKIKQRKIKSQITH